VNFFASLKILGGEFAKYLGLIFNVGVPNNERNNIFHVSYLQSINRKILVSIDFNKWKFR